MQCNEVQCSAVQFITLQVCIGLSLFVILLGFVLFPVHDVLLDQSYWSVELLYTLIRLLHFYAVLLDSFTLELPYWSVLPLHSPTRRLYSFIISLFSYKVVKSFVIHCVVQSFQSKMLFYSANVSQSVSLCL